MGSRTTVFIFGLGSPTTVLKFGFGSRTTALDFRLGSRTTVLISGFGSQTTVLNFVLKYCFGSPQKQYLHILKYLDLNYSISLRLEHFTYNYNDMHIRFIIQFANSTCSIADLTLILKGKGP